jgi:hypothetical protein
MGAVRKFYDSRARAKVSKSLGKLHGVGSSLPVTLCVFVEDSYFFWRMIGHKQDIFDFKNIRSAARHILSGYVCANLSSGGHLRTRRPVPLDKVSTSDQHKPICDNPMVYHCHDSLIHG